MKDYEVLLNFYLYSDLGDKEYINNFLVENELEIDQIANNLLELLQNKKAEIKLKEGRKFKENYLKELNEEKLKNYEEGDYSTAQSEMIAAFRKVISNGDEDEKDILDDAKKMEILKRLKNKKNKPSDEK